MSPRPHFHLLGIPVRVEPFFVVVAVLFGLRYSEVDLIIAWALVTVLSVLVHELGHALVYRAFGERSSIVLHGFGGFTVGAGRVRLSRAQRIVVSVVGSVTALVLLWLPLRSLVGGDWYLRQDLFVQGLVYFGAFVNLWWSVANLLPIRPLDGGHVSEELFGLERARWLSIGFAAFGAVWALGQDQTYAALFAGLLGFMNFSEIRAERNGMAMRAFDVDAPDPGGAAPSGRAGGPRRAGGRRGRRGRAALRSVPPSAPAPPGGGLDPERLRQAAWSALREGDLDRARRLVGGLGAGAGPWLAAAVALDGDSVDGYVAAWAARPDGPPSLVATQVLGDSGHAVEVARRLLAERGSAGRQAAATLQTHLHYSERWTAAAEVGEVVYTAGPTSPAQTAFEVACSWARLGDVDRAVNWLERAAADGFRAASLVDGEPDLAAVRADPRWPVVRAQLV